MIAGGDRRQHAEKDCGFSKRESRRVVKPGGSHASAVVSGGWEYDRRASEIRQMLVTALRPNEPGSPIVILRPKVAPSPVVSLGPNAP